MTAPSIVSNIAFILSIEQKPVKLRIEQLCLRKLTTVRGNDRRVA